LYPILIAKAHDRDRRISVTFAEKSANLAFKRQLQIAAGANPKTPQ
jgi:hypothetical protein